MVNFLKTRLLLIMILIMFPFSIGSSRFTGEIVLDDFQNGLSPGWKEKSFKGHTLYSTVQDDGRWCIRAVSKDSASGLYYKIEYDPGQYPLLAWSWKIAHVLTKGDARTKQGDDFAARVYVIFPSVFFWQSRAINYVWANKLPQGESVPSPFTSNEILIAVQSGPEHAGKWVEERRNIVEDYRSAFGEAPSKVGAIAIMTDTDNTDGEVVAWYGPIRILSAPRQSRGE